MTSTMTITDATITATLDYADAGHPRHRQERGLPLGPGQKGMGPHVRQPGRGRRLDRRYH